MNADDAPPPLIERLPFIDALAHRLADRRVNTVVIGPAGFGKSTLLRTYVQRYGQSHSKIISIQGHDFTEHADSNSLIWKRISESESRDWNSRPLVVIDALDEAHPSSQAVQELGVALRSIRAQFLISTRPLSHQLFQTAMEGHDFESLHLSGFSHSDISSLLREYKVTYSNAQLRRLVEVSGGNPLIVSLVASQLGSHALAWNQLETAFAEFESPGILLPNGSPATKVQSESRIFISDISVTNENVWQQLQRNPENLRQLPPRKFEEMVAAMLEKQGYSVELTPASKDGGFDIYVARKEALGSFLYLVECKRFTPPNKVGVHLVRALHGVVQKVRANAGMLVTTSFFTKGAQEYADEMNYTLHLHDFLALKRWLRLL